MEAADPHSPKRFWWSTLPPLIVGASWTLLKYAGWSAVYSSYYGLPSQAWRLKEAGPESQLCGWMSTTLTVTATIVAAFLIPAFKSESLPVA
jgi:hypothetical protein